VGKTVAKISKIKLKIQNIYIQLQQNVKISTTNNVLTPHLCKTVKRAQVKEAKWQNFAQSGHTGVFKEGTSMYNEHKMGFSMKLAHLSPVQY
jgi:hypothetical protein